MALKLEMLRVFQTVAEQGSLSLAAAKLGRTPSAISIMLSQLEDNIGDRLFETDRKNKLTPLGALVLAESRRANEAFVRSTEAIRRHAMSTAGLIRIAAVPSATVTLLPNVVTSFRKHRPDVRLEISDVDTASVVRRVQLDEADIGIISSETDTGHDGEIILTDELGIVCHKESAISAAWSEGRQTWDVLALELFIANPLCSIVKAPEVQAILLECNLEAKNTTALLAFVRNRIGATILPKSAMITEPDLMFLCPANDQAKRHLIKIHAPDRQMSPVARQFWDKL
ncbi:LysR family transcriptional regulator [Marivivens sp. LCG002]|uniref:LysR family transcriptional regulator n=1 Tax=Marivivens sp. LCG002 TaxID=3051171 RepID=UPI002553243B|nr:LysR family transcriptional regulator [Marivivens sp. LCG002]WIV49773.1 LysR family transcriptional regulator [Marivivens sp. LCG002]